MLYDEAHFYAPHYQSIRPAQVPSVTRSQILPMSNSIVSQVPRSQLPSVNSTIGQPILQSTTMNQTCDQTCESQGSTSVRSRKNREQSYMSDANIIEKRTRASKK